MSQFNQIFQKVPRFIFVLGVLMAALILIVFTNPMSDGCEVEHNLFYKNVRGILTQQKLKKNKTQFAVINYQEKNCRDGNSEGACRDYLDSLRKISTSLIQIKESCVVSFLENDESIIPFIEKTIKILSLLAWGEEPPQAVTKRGGWFNESDISTFCRLKNFYLNAVDEDQYKALKYSIYIEYPNRWPDSWNIEQRAQQDRPKAFKTNLNPNGQLTEQEVYEKSLLSIRCDMFQ